MDQDSTLSCLPAGLAGLSHAWRLVHRYCGAPLWLIQVSAGAALAALLTLLAADAVKAWSRWQAPRARLAHSGASDLSGTLAIGLLLPCALAPYSLPLALLAIVLGLRSLASPGA